MVRSNTPSRGLQVGHHVRVPWGLDTLDGVVEDLYETGAGWRVVVRLRASGTSEEAETVSLPAEAVELVDEAEGGPSGAWVPGARYERSVAEALQRVLRALLAEGDIQARTWPQPLIRPDHRPDFLIQAGPQMLVIEAKTSRPEKDTAAEAIHQLRAYLANVPWDASGLVVTDAEVTPDTRALLYENPRVHVVRWRSARDDRRLAAAVAPLLPGIKQQKQED
jgi:hypothetical protein